MAPSAISSHEGTNGAGEATMEGDGSTSGSETPSYGPKELYTNAYTHGYTEGYISGYAQPRQMPIAIVGMSCRLPGNVNTPDEFWELLSRARTGWSEIPKERFENASFHHPNPGKGGCFNAVGGNFLREDLGLFDAPFFSLTSQEATSMDPQQRLLLECTFEALDSAGIPKHQVVGKEMGVFIGGSFSEYESQLFSDTDTIPMYQATGCAFAMQSNRISHFFDLRGPSFTMDTACSSSLVALHQACQSLRNGESKSAIVGGCHLNMLPEFWVSMSKSRLFSDQGRSFSFDSRGTGYGRGEGCGIVILKPLDQALKDNDIIRSVIVASGINQDGKTSGITMPNGSAQESLMQSVYKNAGINPKETGYIEAHGTGTKVGDPIEAAALHKVFGEDRSVRNPLFVGSVKSNIGHLEAASGIISVIKTAMMLERGFILPNYDFKKPNEKIPFSKWHLKVPVSQRPWPRPKRFASVNNFGFGGTNAHVVLERAPFLPEPESEAEPMAPSRKLFILSANDKSALEAKMKNIGIYLEQRPEIFQNDLMSNIAYTLGQRRSLMQWRVAISGVSSFELIEALNSGKVSPARETEPPRIGFIFTGQGAQCARMGWELYEQYPVFASTLDACDRYLTSLNAPFSLLDELQKDAKASLVNEAHISQPACTAIQLALTDLLKSWGISPSAVAGHSSGEIGAAYAAGILPLESCMAISYHRGMATISLRKNFPDLRGSMIAVGCSKEEITPLISSLENPKAVRIACYNSPISLTISGDEPAIDELQILLERQQIFNRKLQVDVAYHSHHMKLVAEEYHDLLQKLDSPQPTPVRFHSSLYGHSIGGSKLESHYWVDNLTQSVRFSEALMSMCEPVETHKTGVNMIIEIGPHAALAGPIKQILKACGPNAMKIHYSSALVRKKDAVETALELASTLFVKGATLKISAINQPKPSKQPTLLVDMPRYPWNHQTKYWHESRMMQKHKNRPTPRHDLLGTLANYSNDLEPTWRNILRADDLPWLRHHKIQSLTLFPMSGFLAMALEAASQRAASRNIQFETFELRDVSVNTPLMLTDEDTEMTLQLRPLQGSLVSSDLWDEFRIHSWAVNKGWTEHCKGIIAVKAKPCAETSIERIVSEITGAVTRTVEKTKMYDSLSELGVSYGPSFQGVTNCQASDNSSTAIITVMDTAHEMPQEFQTSSIIHPSFLEQLIEMYWPIIGAGRKSIKTVYLPSAVGRMAISRSITGLTSKPGDTLRAFCKGVVPSSHPKPVQMSLFATSPHNTSETLIVVDDLTIAPIIERDITAENEVHRELCYKLAWEPILQPLGSSTNGTANGGSGLLDGLKNGVSNGISTVINGISNGSSTPSPSEVIIIHGESEAQHQLASRLASSVEHTTGKLPEFGLLASTITPGKLCVFVVELDKPLLSSLTATQFSGLQKILNVARGVLWVVRGAYLNSTNPSANMVTGLSRSIRSETMLKFATLDLDSYSQLSEEDTVEAILEVFKATIGPKAEENCELEFTERKGHFLTPRIVNDTEMNEYVHQQTKGSTLEPTLFIQEGRSLKMVIGTPGALETLHFIDQSMDESLAVDEVEIEVKAIGMNSQDVAAAMGQLDNYELGVECSGIITRIGSNINNLVIGDRIAGIAISKGVYSTRTRIALGFKIPAELSFEQAASIPVAFCTAKYGLVNLGGIEKDERVLIHGATTPAGLAALCIAQIMNAEVFATVNSLESKQLVTSKYNLANDHVFIDATGSAVRQNQFDVVLDCQPANSDTIRQLWDSLGSFGRFVELEKQAINPRLTTSHNRSYMSLDLMSLASERPKIMTRLLSDVSELVAKGKIGPLSLITLFPISDVETVFKTLQAGNVEGKLVVVPQPGDMVEATPSSKQNNLLRANATYILIGGTGGLGRSMARWMVNKGARNLVLVSRSGSAGGKVKELIDELALVGAKILVQKCDVADAVSVANLISKDLVGMPEIKGVIHGAMVLDDVLFEKMTFDQYETVISSKLHGAWNFHNALQSQTLDFFVAISSAAGAVGNRGQAAYSAANTFLNAFIQHRNSLNLPSSSIDLTAISDVGYLAENSAKASEVSKNLGSDTICEAEVLALVGAAISGRLASTCNNHTITGMRITTPPPFWTPDAKFSHLRTTYEASVSSSSQKSISYNALLRNAKTFDDALAVVCEGLLNKLPEVLMMEKADMDVARNLSSYNLDSLVAIEVRNYIAREFEASLQVLELLGSGSIEGLGRGIVGKSRAWKGEEK